MLIVCPSCASEYVIDPTRIGPDGRSVRCASCRASWFVGPVALDDGRPRAEGGTNLPALRREAPLIEQSPTLPPSPRAPAPTPRRGAERAAIAALLTAAVALPALLAFREPVVRAVPATAGLFGAVGLPVNLVGLTLGDVASSTGTEAGGPVLVVEGTIRPSRTGTIAVPPLRYVIEGTDGATLYEWSTKPPVAELSAGEAVRFTARLTAPPPAGRRVVVSFGTKREGDAVALR